MNERPAIGPFMLFAVGAECFNRDVEANFVAIFKTIRNCLLGRIDADRNPINLDDLGASAEGRLRKPENSDGQAVKTRYM